MIDLLKNATHKILDFYKKPASGWYFNFLTFTLVAFVISLVYVIILDILKPHNGFSSIFISNSRGASDTIQIFSDVYFLYAAYFAYQSYGYFAVYWQDYGLDSRIGIFKDQHDKQILNYRTILLFLLLCTLIYATKILEFGNTSTMNLGLLPAILIICINIVGQFTGLIGMLVLYIVISKMYIKIDLSIQKIGASLLLLIIFWHLQTQITSIFWSILISTPLSPEHSRSVYHLASLFVSTLLLPANCIALVETFQPNQIKEPINEDDSSPYESFIS